MKSKVKWVKRVFLFGLFGLIAFALVEAKHWPFWYSLGRGVFIDARTQPLANMLESRFPTQRVAGDSKGLATLAKPPKSVKQGQQNQFAEVIEYAELMGRDSLLIWHENQLVYEQYWNGLNRDFRPESASMHKSVLGLLFAIAWDDGFINPDDKIGQYLAEWRDDPRGNITIEQLLTMSSGLEKLSLEGGIFSPMTGLHKGRKSRKIVTAMPQHVEPGTQFWYQNAVSQLAGYVLTSATGKSYTDYLAEKLWKPIGADDAFVNPEHPDSVTPRTYSSLFARPYDWLKVGLLILREGEWNGRKILSKRALNRALASSIANPNYGWQMWFARERQHPRYYNDAKEGISIPMASSVEIDDLVFFDGFGGQRVYISRSLDVVIVTTGQVRLDLDDSVIPNAAAKAVREMAVNMTEQGGTSETPLTPFSAPD